MPWIAIAIALLVALGLFAIMGAVAAQKRRERTAGDSFRQLADELGLAYEPKTDRDFRDAWAALPQIPKQGEVHHLIYGTLEDLPVTFFRHRYVVSTGQAAAVILHWVFSTEVPDWPEVHLKRRTALARAFGGRSDVTGDDHFNRDWIVKTDNRAFARALLGPQTREFLERPRQDAKKIRETWHIVGGKLCCVVRANIDASTARLQAQRLRDMLATISGDRLTIERSA